MKTPQQLANENGVISYQNVSNKIHRTCRYKRMYRRGKPRERVVMKDRRSISPYPLETFFERVPGTAMFVANGVVREEARRIVNSREAATFRALALIEPRMPSQKHIRHLRRMARKQLRRQPGVPRVIYGAEDRTRERVRLFGRHALDREMGNVL